MNRKMFVSLGTVLLATAILLTLLTLLAQSDSAAPQPARAAPLAAVPAVTEVAPTSAPNDLDTAIVISGTDFVVSATVLLDDATLDDVGWVCTTTLTATVPWGMEPGVYTVTVVNPGEGAGSRTDAFTVTEGLGVWTTGGPYGGLINDLHVNPLDPARVYAVVYETGLFISHDSGASWQLALASSSLENITFDAADKDVLTVGGGGVLHHSQDGGQSWEALVERGGAASHLHHCYIHKPVAHPIDSGIFYDAVHKCPGSPVLPDLSGVYLVQDHGSTWITRTNTLTDTDISALAVHPNDGDTLLAGTFSGNIFYSTDGGVNWAWKYSVGEYTIRELYFDPNTQNAWVLYIDFTGQGDADSSVAVSVDVQYDTWWTRTVTTTFNEPVGSLDFTPGKVWAGQGNLFVSSDTGQTWAKVTERDDDGFKPDTTLFTINQNNPQIIYSNGHIDGVYKSTNGGVFWNRSSDGLAGLVPYDLAVYPADPDILYARASSIGLLWTRNGGESWGMNNFWGGGFPGPGFFAVDPITDTRLYLGDAVGLNQTGIGVADQVGGEWQTIYTSTFPLAPPEECGSITALTPHPTMPGRLLAGVIAYPCDEENELFEGTGHLFLSTDHGRTWSDVSPAGSFGWTGHIMVSPKDPDRVYGANFEESVLRSDDAGATWQIFPIATLTDTYASRIAVHPNDPDTVFVHFSSFFGPQLYRSTDGGQTWTLLHDNGGEHIVIAPPVPNALVYTIYMGCHFGERLCRSTDNGNTWEEVPGAPRPTALAVGIAGERARLYIGTPGGMVAQFTPEEMLLGAGVYRWTSLLPTNRVYLPLILKGSGLFSSP